MEGYGVVASYKSPEHDGRAKQSYEMETQNGGGTIEDECGQDSFRVG